MRGRDHQSEKRPQARQHHLLCSPQRQKGDGKTSAINLRLSDHNNTDDAGTIEKQLCAEMHQHLGIVVALYSYYSRRFDYASWEEPKIATEEFYSIKSTWARNERKKDRGRDWEISRYFGRFR